MSRGIPPQRWALAATSLLHVAVAVAVAMALSSGAAAQAFSRRDSNTSSSRSWETGAGSALFVTQDEATSLREQVGLASQCYSDDGHFKRGLG